jgi:hypothetical protein
MEKLLSVSYRQFDEDTRSAYRKLLSRLLEEVRAAAKKKSSTGTAESTGSGIGSDGATGSAAQLDRKLQEMDDASVRQGKPVAEAQYLQGAADAADDAAAAPAAVVLIETDDERRESEGKRRKVHKPFIQPQPGY